MQFFTRLDSRHGYWQVPLDEHSSTLTIFLTPWGPYRFKRNVIGLISAGDGHNRRSDDAFAGMENVVIVVEDVLIFDKDFATPVKRVKSAIKRCSEHSIIIHPKKFIFAQSSVSYCGCKVSRHGYRIDEHLVQALQKFPFPTSRTDVRSFCGLVQQFGAFCPELTDWMAPIRALLSPEADFIWTSSQASAISKVIQVLSSPRILASFDPGKPLRLETDAAQSRGLGMALWQQDNDGTWRLLQCGSRNVTSLRRLKDLFDFTCMFAEKSFQKTQKWSSVYSKNRAKTFRRLRYRQFVKKTDEKSGLRNYAWREKDRGTHVQTSEESLCQVQVEAALGSERIEGRNEKRKNGRKSSWEREIITNQLDRKMKINFAPQSRFHLNLAKALLASLYMRTTIFLSSCMVS